MRCLGVRLVWPADVPYSPRSSACKELFAALSRLDSTPRSTANALPHEQWAAAEPVAFTSVSHRRSSGICAIPDEEQVGCDTAHRASTPADVHIEQSQSNAYRSASSARRADVGVATSV
jgi:hypothetical protein